MCECEHMCVTVCECERVSVLGGLWHGCELMLIVGVGTLGAAAGTGVVRWCSGGGRRWPGGAQVEGVVFQGHTGTEAGR